MRRVVCLLVVIGAWLYASPAAAASCSSTSLGNGFTCVQSVSTLGGGGASTTAACPAITVTAGNLLVVAGVWRSDGGQTASVADGGGQTFTAVGTAPVANGVYSVNLWRFPNTASGSRTITLTLSASSSAPKIACAEISGAATAAELDQTAGQGQAAPGSGTDAITSGVTSTRTNAADVIVGAMVDDSGFTTISAGTGYTVYEGGQDGSGVNYMELEFKSVGSTGTDAATFTHTSATSNTATVVAAFKAASGAAAPCTLSLLGVGRC